MTFICKIDLLFYELPSIKCFFVENFTEGSLFLFLTPWANYFSGLSEHFLPQSTQSAQRIIDESPFFAERKYFKKESPVQEQAGIGINLFSIRSRTGDSLFKVL